MERESNINVSNTERIISVLAGSYFIYRALARDPKQYGILAPAALLVYRGVTGHCPAYAAIGKSRLPDTAHNINIETSVTVNKPTDTVYAFWRRLENLPLFMTHLKSVTQLENGRSEWQAYIPGGLGTSISWEAEIVKEEPGKQLSWNSIEGSTINNAGKVIFEHAGEQATTIHVVISYQAPLGAAGEKALSLFTSTFEKMIQDDILNFKEYIETGKLPADKKLKHKNNQPHIYN
ncbi:SRPBCC family protein [Cytophaga aurantiaca]|uniref:SRPBCC family protein n=1 Tax=Cytophaga aurantiaca TaxID=29530 RepID=UPI0003A98E0B|nr:SRPBCC family protein [Cytophaga aurantiaca]